jgi:hypothetical protein
MLFVMPNETRGNKKSCAGIFSSFRGSGDFFFQTMFKFFSDVPCAENFFAELLRFLLLKFPFAVVVNQRGF